eukprot:483073-Rhodomonas_salina.2
MRYNLKGVRRLAREQRAGLGSARLFESKSAPWHERSAASVRGARAREPAPARARRARSQAEPSVVRLSASSGSHRGVGGRQTHAGRPDQPLWITATRTLRLRRRA